jgi:hypothetical protein
MTNLIEAFERNPIAIEIEEKEWELPEKGEATARDQKHLEMAYEWLRRKRNGSQFYSSSDFAECESLENREAMVRNWQHFELAYEFLRRKGKIMALIRKRRIWWEVIPEATSYVVYVSKDSAIFDPAKFLWEATPGIISKQVIGKTELIIPDEWPEFPMEPGTYYIGITSEDDMGNQSPPFLLSAVFRFLAPLAPVKAGIESL